VRRLCVCLVLMGGPLWMPWIFTASVGEIARPPVVAAPAPTRPAPLAVAVLAPSAPTVTTVRPRPPAPVPARPAHVAAPFVPAHFVAFPPLRPRSQRPALADDFPDPDIIRVGSTWWAYATGTGFDHLQVRESPDLVTWGPATDPLPRLPAWAAPAYAWAPSVTPTTGGFLLYYSIRDPAYGRQCVSVASAPTPAGPFVDASAGPLTCQTGVGGSIDPDTFTDADGSTYLVWKSEENALGLPSEIGAQRLAPDGHSVVGPRPRLLTATARWQARVVEGPSMIAANGHYYLFYGANHWDTAAAGIGYAVCATPIGPCTDESRSGPWLASAPGAFGPSGPDVFVGLDGRAWLAYHAWNGVPHAGEPGPLERQLWIMPVTFTSGAPVIG